MSLSVAASALRKNCLTTGEVSCDLLTNRSLPEVAPITAAKVQDLDGFVADLALETTWSTVRLSLNTDEHSTKSKDNQTQNDLL